MNKKVRNACPTIYNGIDFKSKLELYCYKKLAEANIKADYEPIRFTILDSFKLNGESVRAMTYTPDFVGVEFVIECKGMMNDAFPLRWKLFKHYLYMNKLTFDLYLPRNHKDIDQMVKTILERRKNEQE